MMLPTRPTSPAPMPAIELLMGVWDSEVLLTYEGKQTAAQRARVNAAVALEHGIETDGNTMADDLG